MHSEPHPLAGQEIQTDLKAVHPQLGDSMIHTAIVEDWWDRLTGNTWYQSYNQGNPAAMVYGIRTMFAEDIPLGDDVLYVKIGPFGHIIHDTEILR